MQILLPFNTKSKIIRKPKIPTKKARNSTASIKVDTTNKIDNKANTNNAKQVAKIKTKTTKQNSTRKGQNPPGDNPAESKRC